MHLPKHPFNTVQDLLASITGGCLFLDTIAEKTKKTTTNHNNFGYRYSIITCYTWRNMIMNESECTGLATNHNK